MTGPKLDEPFWSNLYQTGQTAWDLGYPSTPLKTYIDQLPDKNIRILIPGCGNAYEAEYLLEKGFTNVTMLDISAVLVKKLQQKFAKKPARILNEDFFEHRGEYDLILEQTFFCTLPPQTRPAYVQKMHDLLAPGGTLAGVLFNRSFEDGPPFGGSKSEYDPLFAAQFREIRMELCYNSIPPRRDTELFIIARRTD